MCMTMVPFPLCLRRNEIGMSKANTTTTTNVNALRMRRQFPLRARK